VRIDGKEQRKKGVIRRIHKGWLPIKRKGIDQGRTDEVYAQVGCDPDVYEERWAGFITRR
jgi:hypothetical protein